ncbi:MAG: hypothetical protein C4527_15745 [Candidatus Omnitrophota bacterium]|jgi:hypothetical protein|nr:MAG: hypothetical protein C4527_15745 [Candidatus Omnitrophota bacterium]
MKHVPKILIFVSILSIFLGVLVKVFGIQLSDYVFSDLYPFRPQSFIDFANTLLLLSIALIGMQFLNKND